MPGSSGIAGWRGESGMTADWLFSQHTHVSPDSASRTVTFRRSFLALLIAALPLARSGAQFTADEYAHRRAALLAQITEGVVIALGAHEPAQDYLSFYQGPSFNYLTGFLEPDAVLVLTKTARASSS